MNRRYLRSAPFIVVIGDGEVWAVYRRIEYALQAMPHLHQQGFAPRLLSGSLRNLTWRLRAFEDEQS